MTKKLKLSTETIRTLDVADLQQVNGGLSLGVFRGIFKPNVFTNKGFISSSGSGG